MTKITQMACSACGYAYSKARSTSRDEHGSIRRQRICLRCNSNFTTYEIPASDHAILAALRKWRRADNVLTNVTVQNGAA